MAIRHLLLPLVVAALPTWAKNLHVNNSGTPSCSDATTYANNDSSNPWCTIGRAAWGSTSYASPNSSQAARAGDTVSITSGTYITEGNKSFTGCRWLVALNPANSGTSGSFITFKGVGTVNIRLASGSYGPTIGANQRNYIVWDSVRIDETAAAGVSCADTGPVVFHESTGSKIVNSKIRGTYKTWSDNYCGVRGEAVNSLTIAHNVIYDITCNFSSNCAAIMLYDAADSVFEHNHIRDSATGIYIKGDHEPDSWPFDNNITRLNWFENLSSVGIYINDGTNNHVYQNVVKNASVGIKLNIHAKTTSTTRLVNNAIISSGVGGQTGVLFTSAAPTGGYFYNNIVSGAWANAMDLGGLSSGGTMGYEHNVYYNFSNFGQLNGRSVSFAAWQSAHGYDSVSPAGVARDPQFSTTAYPGGYRLSVGSPAVARGIDILDLDADGSTIDAIPSGAYVTGRETIGPSSRTLLSTGTQMSPARTIENSTPGFMPRPLPN